VGTFFLGWHTTLSSPGGQPVVNFNRLGLAVGLARVKMVGPLRLTFRPVVVQEPPLEGSGHKFPLASIGGTKKGRHIFGKGISNPFSLPLGEVQGGLQFGGSFPPLGTQGVLYLQGLGG